MAAIIPQGTIWLLKNIPLDNTYQHTLYWSLDSGGRTEQENYFLSNSHIVHTFTNQYYTRVNNNKIRVGWLADDLLVANYLVFRNSPTLPGATSFSNKLYYCFITSINYINNNVTEIEFEIDVIQTWYFDFDLLPCFMERTHARNDAKYSNIVPEPVEVGEYIYQQCYREAITSDLAIIVSYVSVTGGVSTQGQTYANIYGGAMLKAFKPTDTSGIDAFITQFIQSPESIVSIYMCPRCLIALSTIPDGGVDLSTGDVMSGKNTLATAIPDNSDYFGSYLPHNNKLYSYPYTMLEVFTPEGTVVDYRYEFFENAQNRPVFSYGGSVTVPVELTLIPTQYKVPSGSAFPVDMFTESISLKNYPICSWNNDTYKAWAAQNAVPMAINALGNAAVNTLYMGAAMATMNPLAMYHATTHAISSGIQNISHMLQEGYKASIAADKLNGQSRGNTNISMDTQGFYFAQKVINESSARIIDSFFDMFGYAVKKIQEPLRKTRAFYTFVKTIGCVIEEKQWASNVNYGNEGIPADDANKICQLHDNGITYWDAANLAQNGTIGGKTYHVGDYSIAPYNSPIG